MSPVVLADSGVNSKIFVLDTNLLMHDPSALFKFQEHHVYRPMTVLEELDNAKIGVSEVARNLRQTYVVDRFKHWQHSGHITLMNVERSRLADYAAEML